MKTINKAIRKNNIFKTLKKVYLIWPNFFLYVLQVDKKKQGVSKHEHYGQYVKGIQNQNLEID